MSHSKEFPFIKLNKKRIYKYNESSNKTKYISYFFNKKNSRQLTFEMWKSTDKLFIRITTHSSLRICSQWLRFNKPRQFLHYSFNWLMSKLKINAKKNNIEKRHETRRQTSKIFALMTSEWNKEISFSVINNISFLV